jgi:rare lipoprotein A
MSSIRRWQLFGFSFLAAAAFFSCAPTIHPPPPTVQTGMASWYGPKFHGRHTSSKEVFNMYDLTAAHKSLPFGTYVAVTNLDNGKSVTVRINDRGPFIKGRIIDLSYAAAKTLDMLNSGVALVRIEILTKYSPKKSSQKFSVQVGSFVLKSNAEALLKRLDQTYKGVYITPFKTVNHVYFRVRIKARNAEAAQRIAQRLSEEGYAVIVLEEQ